MLRQVNPSSDRSGGGQEADSGVLRHSPSRQPLQEQPSQDQNYHPDEFSGQHSPPSRLCPEFEIEHRAHVPNPDAADELQSSQADNQRGFASFRGSDLVDWLLERGLCAGRIEGELYGVRLQRGGVLDHVTGEHGFRDEPSLLYRFTQGKDETEEEDERDRR